MTRFYLGAPNPAWLKRTDVPLFVSHIRLAPYVKLPTALGRWALDSGGFTQLSQHGEWKVSAAEYAESATRYTAEIGGLDWASPQDWMCEPWVTDKTGKSVRDHQERTVNSVLELRELAPTVPFAPVLQGWELPDYLACVELYEAAGIDLRTEPIVGLGSVCRRQATSEIGEIITELSGYGLNLHGFGVKLQGLRGYGAQLTSADSMAWSYSARMGKVRLASCEHANPVCSYCLTFALQWREKAIKALEGEGPSAPIQERLF